MARIRPASGPPVIFRVMSRIRLFAADSACLNAPLRMDASIWAARSFHPARSDFMRGDSLGPVPGEFWACAANERPTSQVHQKAARNEDPVEGLIPRVYRLPRGPKPPG